MTIGAAVIAVAIAGFLAWQKWGEGKWNLGPRLAAVLFLAFGASIAAILWPFGDAITRWLAGTAHGLVRGVGHPEWSPLVTTVVTYAPWVSGLGLLAIWVVAIIPDKISNKVASAQRMDWRMSMTGMVIPALLVTAPAGVRTIEEAVVSGTVPVATSVYSFLTSGGHTSQASPGRNAPAHPTAGRLYRVTSDHLYTTWSPVQGTEVTR